MTENQSVSCVICHRKLTHPDSVKRGLGPICSGAPNRVRRRFSGKIRALPGLYISLKPHDDNLMPVLNMLKLFTFCMSCKNFLVHESNTSKKMKHEDKVDNKLRYTAEVRPLFSVPYNKAPELKHCGECAFYRIEVDGNLVVQCPHFVKMKGHKLQGSDKIEFVDEQDTAITMTGNEIYNRKLELKLSRNKAD